MARALLRDLAGLDGAASDDDAAQLGRWIATVAPAQAPWVPLIADAVGVDVPSTSEVERLDPAFLRDRRHAAITAVLIGALARPTLLLVEDAHWLDDASSELLAHVTRAGGDRPWLVLVTRRPDGAALDVDAPHHEVITLGPLPDASIGELVLQAAGDVAFTDDAIARLATRAAGNPLYLRELVASAAAGVDELPDTVERVIASRIDLLPAPARRLLRDAAVLGRTVDLALLGEVLGDDAIAVGDRWRPLEEYVERANGVARFRHDLFRLASYEGLSYRRRRELHARVGALLEARDDADVAVVALHYCEAQHHDKAWEWSRRAADDAREKSALVEAFDLYRRALHAARHCDAAAVDIAEVAERLGDAATLLGRYHEANAAFALVRRYASVGVTRARALRKQGDVDELAARYSSSLRRYTRRAR